MNLLPLYFDIAIGFLVFEFWPIVSLIKGISLLYDEAWYSLENLYGMLPMVEEYLLVAWGAVFMVLPLDLRQTFTFILLTVKA